MKTPDLQVRVIVSPLARRPQPVPLLSDAELQREPGADNRATVGDSR